MNSIVTFKQIIFNLLKRFDVDKVGQIESDMDLEDRISLYYLLTDDPKESLQELKMRYDSRIITDWCRDVSSWNQGEWKLRVIESLVLMQHFKTLEHLGYKRRELLDVRQILDCAQRSPKFDVKKALYSALDTLTVEELKRFIQDMGCDEVCGKPAHLYSPKYIEIYLLEWQASGKIRLEEDCLKEVLSKLDKLHFTAASNVLKQFIEKMNLCPNTSEECDQHEYNICEETDYQDQDLNVDIYPILDRENVGLCIIVNEEKYLPTCHYKPRRGSHMDCDRIIQTMSVMKVNSIVLENLEHNRIFPSIEDAVHKNFLPKVHSVLFVVIMAHGQKDHLVGIDGKYVNTGMIRESLSNTKFPWLKDKPKIVIFQACRGYHFYDMSGMETDGPDIPEVKQSMSNYLICWPTIPGFVSLRGPFYGTPYIQTLCSCLEKYYKRNHIMDIMTQVNREFKDMTYQLQFDRDSESSNYTVGLHPEIECDFTGRLYLHKE